MKTKCPPMSYDLPRNLKCLALNCGGIHGSHIARHPFQMEDDTSWERLKPDGEFVCEDTGCHSDAIWRCIRVTGGNRRVWYFCSEHASVVPDPAGFEIVLADRPATKEEEDQVILRGFRDCLTRISNLLEMPGSPDLTQLHLELEKRLQRYKEECAAKEAKNVILNDSLKRLQEGPPRLDPWVYDRSRPMEQTIKDLWGGVEFFVIRALIEETIKLWPKVKPREVCNDEFRHPDLGTLYCEKKIGHDKEHSICTEKNDEAGFEQHVRWENRGK